MTATHMYVSSTHRLSERHHELSTEVHILEHALQLVGELTAALGLQLCDHVLLGIGAGTASQQQALCQVLLVESLEHVFSLRDQTCKWSVPDVRASASSAGRQRLEKLTPKPGL